MRFSTPDFQPVIRQAAAAELDRIFALHDASLLFYGHDHDRSDVQGRAHYVNPGSLGCYHRPVARYCMASFQNRTYTIEQRAVPYADEALLRAFEKREVPERHFIYRAFFGGRFHSE